MTSGFDFRTVTSEDLEAIVELWCASARYHEEIEERFRYA